MIRTLSVTATSLVAATSCGPLAVEPHPTPARFESSFHATPDRVWVGPDFWANRLQDWRVVDGTLECVEARPRFGMRTLHLLTRHLGGADEGAFRVEVVIDADEGDRAGSAAGFLVGAGGEHVDHRLTSQVHGTSAEDGGWLALVDGDGKAVIKSFEEPVEAGGGGQWVMASNRELDQFAAVPGVEQRGDGFGEAGPRPVSLEAVGSRFDGRDTFVLVVRDAETRDVLSTASWSGAPDSLYDGAVALVSHRGPAVDEGTPSGYRFRDWRVEGDAVRFDGERAFGPIMFVHYTLDEKANGTTRLRMTAQTGPLGDGDTRTAALELKRAGGSFREVVVAPYVPDSATFHFDVRGLDTSEETAFRIRYVPTLRDGRVDERATQLYDGVIPARPSDGELTIASLSCQKSYTGHLRWNESGLWFPHAEVARHVAAHEPDLMYFAGDQIYEGDLTPAIQKPHEAAMGDYLTKWYRHGWSFGELTRRLPTVVVTDDHDVYHGNIWGNEGVTEDAPGIKSLQDRGGYKMSARFVNAVHRTQVSHLPRPADPTPLANGVTRYATTLNYGGGSYAILADRMDKSPPAVVVPDGGVVNGWFQADGFDPVESADVPGARLLGEGQLAMLREWADASPPGAWFKACLSQTPFANVATIPRPAKSGSVIPSLQVPEPGEYVEGDKRAADTDSNGWPQSGRDAAVRLLRDAGAFHLTGDQHLGSTLRYGVDQFDDAGFVLSSPAVANTWPRRWFPDPAEREPGPEVTPGAPAYTGRYRDGFGNRMTVWAVANPHKGGVEPTRLHDRAPGYGIARVVRDEGAPGGGRVTFEAWPRHADPTADGAAPYGGWPVRFTLGDLGGRGD